MGNEVATGYHGPGGTWFWRSEMKSVFDGHVSGRGAALTAAALADGIRTREMPPAASSR